MRPVAYFSPEFGVSEALPQYSGGLGVLAGDHLKAAADLGLPLTGVGLFYDNGYFHQQLDEHGWQHESFPRLEPASWRASGSCARRGGSTWARCRCTCSTPTV
jgi:starch phosphorylase